MIPHRGGPPQGVFSAKGWVFGVPSIHLLIAGTKMLPQDFFGNKECLVSPLPFIRARPPYCLRVLYIFWGETGLDPTKGARFGVPLVLCLTWYPFCGGPPGRGGSLCPSQAAAPCAQDYFTRATTARPAGGTGGGASGGTTLPPLVYTTRSTSFAGFTVPPTTEARCSSSLGVRHRGICLGF